MHIFDVISIVFGKLFTKVMMKCNKHKFEMKSIYLLLQKHMINLFEIKI